MCSFFFFYDLLSYYCLDLLIYSKWAIYYCLLAISSYKLVIFLFAFFNNRLAYFPYLRSCCCSCLSDSSYSYLLLSLSSESLLFSLYTSRLSSISFIFFVAALSSSFKDLLFFANASIYSFWDLTSNFKLSFSSITDRFCFIYNDLLDSYY